MKRRPKCCGGRQEHAGEVWEAVKQVQGEKEASECSRCVAQDVLGMHRLRRNAEGRGIEAEGRQEAYGRVRRF